MDLQEIRAITEGVRREVRKAVIGQDEAIELMLTSLLVGGHVLLEGVPGTAKTLLTQAFAAGLALQFGRIQFTPDLMPGDVLGTNLFNFQTNSFVLTKGPIFTQLLLADEVNRASPRTQSALLEAMEERQVSADLTTYRLPDPFFVVATQNPHEQLGTYSLPESQLDRFLMRVTLGYPDVAHERELLRSGERRDLLPQIRPALNPEALVRIQAEVRRVHVSDALLDYTQGLIARTRDRSDLKLGLSPRAGQGLIRAAQAWAYLANRSAVLPEDIQAVLPSVVAHRLERRESTGSGEAQAIAQELIRAVPVPL
jgi:MoxR-like ATPase